MSESCPTCGEPVETVTSDEGTSHYESVAAKRIGELEAALRITANPRWVGRLLSTLPDTAPDPESERQKRNPVCTCWHHEGQRKSWTDDAPCPIHPDDPAPSESEGKRS